MPIHPSYEYVLTYQGLIDLKRPLLAESGMSFCRYLLDLNVR